MEILNDIIQGVSVLTLPIIGLALQGGSSESHTTEPPTIETATTDPTATAPTTTELEERLRRAEERLDEFTHSISSAFWSLKDKSSIFEYMSEGAFATLGVSPEVFTTEPHHFERMILKADRLIAINCLRKLRQGINVQTEFRINGMHGQKRMIRVEAAPILDSETGQLRFSGSFTDVSILRQMLESLREAEQRMRAVVDSVGDGIVIIDGSGKIQSLNSAAIKIFGYETQDALGKDLIEFFGTESGNCYKSIHQWRQEILENADNPKRHLVTGRRADGSEFPLEIDLRELVSVNQDHYVAALEDVTEREAHHEWLRQTEKNTAISALAAGVSHEFKNCLGAIMMNATLAQAGLSQPEVMRESLDEIVRVAETADGIAKSLLTYAGAANENTGPTDVKRALQEVTLLLKDRLAKARVNLKNELPELPLVSIGGSDLEQVLMCAIVNSMQASQPDCDVTVRGSYRKKACGCLVTIEIVDSGCGISRDAMRRVFDPFYSTKGVWGDQATQGTGLGLTILKNLVEKANGSVKLSSVEEVETTLTISLDSAKPVSQKDGVKTNLLNSAL